MGALMSSNKPTFVPEKDIPDLGGKVILITGGNAGLGKETIRQLALHNPAHIFLAARSEPKALAAIDELHSSNPNAHITYLPLDLSSFASIAAAAKTFTSSSSRLDILFNNAGIMNVPYALTPEGYETQFGTNHVGHALLTKLLLPTMLRTAEASGADVRVVNLSSDAYQMAYFSNGVIYDAAAAQRRFTMVRYGASKLANMLHARALAQRYPQITAVSVHPGLINTELFDESRGLWRRIPVLGNFMATMMTGRLRPVAEGARNQLWAATADKKLVREGYYFNPVGVKNAGGFYSSKARADQLWDWTEKELARHGY